jgi:pimeloyl-ACP methyl ester carboxylesterase
LRIVEKENRSETHVTVLDEDLTFRLEEEVRDFNLRIFVGPTLSGPLMGLDLTALTDFNMPIFLIHGEADLVIPRNIPRAYFETIRAPRKEFYLVPGTGHNPSAAELEKLRDVLLTQVRPIAVESKDLVLD